jgi:AbiTii
LIKEGDYRDARLSTISDFTMTDQMSKSEHITSLACELLDDVEMSRLSGEQLLLKASRLARLIGSEEVKQWLEFELHGYGHWGHTAVCNKYMGLTGRWTDKEKREGYWQSLSGVEAIVDAAHEILKTLRIPDISMSISSANPSQHVSALLPGQVIDKVMTQMVCAQQDIKKLAPVKGKVIGLIHKFVEGIYYERLFSGMAESVFERYKASVDTLLVGRCTDILTKFPAIYDRLAEGTPEAVSQALSTCRGIIDEFADAIYPASDEPALVKDGTMAVGQQQTLNRVEAYINSRVESDSRRTKLLQSLRNLYKRTNAGVHADVSHDEAQSLMLNVYLVLGEIVLLPNAPVLPVS